MPRNHAFPARGDERALVDCLCVIFPKDERVAFRAKERLKIGNWIPPQERRIQRLYSHLSQSTLRHVYVVERPRFTLSHLSLSKYSSQAAQHGPVFKADPSGYASRDRDRFRLSFWQDRRAGTAEFRRRQKILLHVSPGPDVVSRDDKRGRLAIRSYTGEYTHTSHTPHTRAHARDVRVDDAQAASADSEKSHARRTMVAFVAFSSS